MPELSLHTAALSIVGRRREHNEDAFGFGPASGPLTQKTEFEQQLSLATPGCLLVVSDGIGGSRAGEVASQTAIQALSRDIASATFSEEGVLNLIRRADAAVRKKAAESPDFNDMGATLTLLWLQGSNAIWGQAGDSRCYLWRKGKLNQLTPEHSPVGRLRQAGDISELEARRHPYRHLIDQALGSSQGPFSPEAGLLSMQASDCFVLCSDGLTDGLDDASITALLIKSGSLLPAKLAHRLVHAANDASGSDNITALVARVEAPVQ